MIRNYLKWLKFETKLKQSQKVNIKENFALMEAMYKEALVLKVLPLKDPLAELDIITKIAKVVNSVPAATRKASHRT